MLRQIKELIFQNFSTDQALRYRPVVKLLKQYKLTESKILEVGSGDLGITPYLKKKITGVDISFSQPENNLIKKVLASGSHLPFADNSFEVVINVDSLEHQQEEERQAVIEEMMRVAGNYLIIVAPCGQLSYQQDRELDDFFYNNYGYHDKFLNQHLKNGLPELDQVRKMIEQASDQQKKKVKISYQKLTNLRLRKILMICKISPNKLLKIFYFLFLLLRPVYQIFNFGNCYRCLFFVKIVNS